MAAGLSVVVPAYESWPLLERTLAAVVHDAGRLDVQCEVIVVDNESDPSLVQEAWRRFGSSGVLRTHRRTGLRGSHFQPGAARNEGIARARHEKLVFLDSDCVPAEALLRRYAAELEASPDDVLIGHRVFIDPGRFGADAVARDRALLERAPRVPSESNYGRVADRRLPELHRLATHPRPYDCLFGCNFAIRRDTLGELRFRARYDGHWGYEDIDLGYRLHRLGRPFGYVPEAFVYHQEGGYLTETDRRRQRSRNFAILAAAVPGFASYRARTSRP